MSEAIEENWRFIAYDFIVDYCYLIGYYCWPVTPPQLQQILTARWDALWMVETIERVRAAPPTCQPPRASASRISAPHWQREESSQKRPRPRAFERSSVVECSETQTSAHLQTQLCFPTPQLHPMRMKKRRARNTLSPEGGRTATIGWSCVLSRPPRVRELLPHPFLDGSRTNPPPPTPTLGPQNATTLHIKSTQVE